jgi:hypothetical protein
MRYGGMRAMEQEQLLTEQMQEVRAPEVWHIAAIQCVEYVVHVWDDIG